MIIVRSEDIANTSRHVFDPPVVGTVTYNADGGCELD